MQGLLDVGVEDDDDPLTLDRVEKRTRSGVPRLAVTVFCALLELSEPIVGRGLAAEAAQIIENAHR